MSRLIYNVVRHPGGWAVEYDDQKLCCYRTQEQAIAHARQLGRDGWHVEGRPCQIQVRSITGLLRTEATFGHELQAG